MATIGSLLPSCLGGEELEAGGEALGPGRGEEALGPVGEAEVGEGEVGEGEALGPGRGEEALGPVGEGEALGPGQGDEVGVGLAKITAIDVAPRPDMAL